jgi:hypothetical protein
MLMGKSPAIHCVWGWVGHRAGHNILEKINLLSLPGIEPWTFQPIMWTNTHKLWMMPAVRLHHRLSWFRWLVTGLSLQWPRIALRPVSVGFMVGKLIVGQVFIAVFLFPPISIILPVLHIFIRHWLHINLGNWEHN